MVRLLLCLLMLLCTAPVRAQDAAKIWDKGAALYSKVQTLQIQLETTSWLEKTPQQRAKVTQTLCFERPNRWRLQTTPSKISFVADGKTLFVPGIEERFSVVSPGYPDKLDRALFGAGGQIGIAFNSLLRNTLLPGGKGVQVTALPARKLEGQTVCGVRLRGATLREYSETILWFSADGKLQRSQERMQIEGRIFVFQNRVTQQKLNDLLPPNLFQSPPPFKPDVFEPQAVELLDRAAKFYGSLSSLRLRVRALDQTRDARYVVRASQSGTSTFEFRRPDHLRLERTPDKKDPDSSAFHGLIQDGKMLWQQDDGDAPDTWYRTPIDASSSQFFATDWEKNTPSLSDGTGKVLWRLLHGRSPAPRESERERGVSAFEVQFLGTHPQQKSWKGVRIREWNQRMAASIEERVLWFEVSDPRKPILKRVGYRSDEAEDLRPMERTEEAIEQSDFNPTLPDARFRPAPGARILSND